MSNRPSVCNPKSNGALKYLKHLLASERPSLWPPPPPPHEIRPFLFFATQCGGLWHQIPRHSLRALDSDVSQPRRQWPPEALRRRGLEWAEAKVIAPACKAKRTSRFCEGRRSQHGTTGQNHNSPPNPLCNPRCGGDPFGVREAVNLINVKLIISATVECWWLLKDGFGTLQDQL